jgi:alpha-tubulin suppressor-like RCC1 family protein
MENNSRKNTNLVSSVHFCLIVLLCFAQSVNAANIVQIAVDELGILFALDDEGHVWGARNVECSCDYIKLPNLENIKTIEPYIAVDSKGTVFTWSIDDSKVDTVEGGISQVGFSMPKRVENLQDVTMVAHSMGQFFAVIKNQEIVRWVERRKERGFGIDGYGAIQKVISRDGVKGISVAPGNLTRFVTESEPYWMVTLFEDGIVMGWGVTSSGQISEAADNQPVTLAISKGATGIAMNAFHTVILTADGRTQFWGGCDMFGRDFNGGHPWKYGNVFGVDGYVSDVVQMALAQDINTGTGGWGDDNNIQDVFIKRDGTVWGAYAPIPEAVPLPAYACSRYSKQSDYRVSKQLSVSKAAAKQVATSKGVVFMLDSDGKLWSTNGSWMNTKFREVPLHPIR